MKKVISIFMAIVLIFTAIPFNTLNLKASAEEQANIYDYVVENGEATITFCDEIFLEANATIPSILDGYKVTKIEDKVFENYKYIKSITIPSSVTSIGDYAFYGCERLEEITISDSVTHIGTSAFENTKFYNNLENWENEVLYIGNHLIKSKTSILGSYTVKNQTISIADYAFYDCQSLESIILSDSVVSIGEMAFRECENLESATFGKNLVKIGTDAFWGCDKLKDIYYNNSYRNKIENLSFDYYDSRLRAATWHYAIEDNLLYDYDEATLTATVSGCNEEAVDVVIPKKVTKNGKTYTVTKIATSAFFRITSLKSVTLADTITEIGSSAFSGCTGLVNIIFGKNLKSIGNLAFYNCSYLGTITIPKSVTSIGKNIFNKSDIVCYCYKDSYAKTYLIENNFPYVYIDGSAKENTLSGESDGYKWVLDKRTGLLEFSGKGNSAYINSENSTWYKHRSYITSVEIPEGIVSIGDGVFKDCNILKTVKLPESLTQIGESAFEGCRRLEEINLEKGIHTIGELAFASCSNLKSITIPESLAKIERPVFKDCTSLTTVNFNAINCKSDSIMFEGCENLKNINIGNMVKTIPRYAFRDCKKIEEVILPKSVTIIGDFAFYNCQNLKNITLPNKITSIGSSAFYNCDSLVSITLPETLSEIGALAFKACNKLQKIDVAENNKYFSSINGVLFDKNQTTLIEFPANQKVTSYIVPETVTTIKDSAFSDCDELENITLPLYLTSIEKSAFYGCDNLKSIDIPYGVTAIKSSTFDWCDALEKITIYNPNCVFNKYCGIDRNVTIYGYSYSTAVNYAESIYAGFMDVEDYHTHTFTDATCERPKHCTVCATPDGEALGHKYEGICDEVCDVCDEERIDAHDYDDFCDAVCNICGESRIPPHLYANVCDAICYDCGAKRNAQPHVYDNACDDSCNICGNPRLASPHVYTNICDEYCDICYDYRDSAHRYSGVCDDTCNICGESRRASAHKYTNVCDSTCNVCGIVRSVEPHDRVIYIIPATLSKNGKAVKMCINCGTISSQREIKKVKSITLSTSTYLYNGKVRKPGVTVKDSAGKVVSSKYYTVSYPSGRKNVGKYKVTIKFKGEYSGTKYIYFAIIPPKSAVSKLTAGKKSLTVNLTKKSAQVTGYQIQYSTNKNFKNAKTKTISSYKTTKTTIKSLSAKKTYYVRVRTYKKVGKTIYCSTWSAAKSKKTK